MCRMGNRVVRRDRVFRAQANPVRARGHVAGAGRQEAARSRGRSTRPGMPGSERAGAGARLGTADSGPSAGGGRACLDHADCVPPKELAFRLSPGVDAAMFLDPRSDRPYAPGVLLRCSSCTCCVWVGAVCPGAEPGVSADLEPRIPVAVSICRDEIHAHSNACIAPRQRTLV